MLLCIPYFLFLGLTMTCIFQGYYFWRKIANIWGIHWWMVDDANFQCRNFAIGGGRVRDLDQESMKKILTRVTQFDKTQRNSKKRTLDFFSMLHDIWLW